MTLIDTHAHIYLPEFEPETDTLLTRAAEAGVTKVLMPAIDTGRHESLLSLEKRNPATCLAMMGLHPCSVKENYTAELDTVKTWLDKRNFVAVGEIGLDFYWDKTYTTQQYDAFEKQIGWAIEKNIPIVIHSRNATDECIKVIRQYQNGKLRGVFHCFSGDARQAEEVMDLGFYLGIGGVVTFKNAGLDKVMEQVPMDKVVLETDAPYLAPVPFRGKRNEPSYLKYVVEKLAGIKNISPDEVGRITTENASALFGLG